MKPKTKLLLLSLILIVAGLILIAVCSHWLAAAGVFLVIWGNNVDQSVRRQKIANGFDEITGDGT